MTFDHVGIVVQEIDQGRQFCQSVMRLDLWTEVFADKVNGVYVQFGRSSATPVMELIAPLGDNSPIAGSIDTGVNRINHLAFRVDCLATGGEEMRQARCIPLAKPRPAVAYGGALVQFFLSPQKFIVELIEKEGDTLRFNYCRD